MTEELPDTAEAMDSQETAHVVPAGWWALFVGLILWGVYYLFAYSPWASGWTQAGELAAATAAGPAAAGASGTNVLLTVLFTALATGGALLLAAIQMRRRR